MAKAMQAGIYAPGIGTGEHGCKVPFSYHTIWKALINSRRANLPLITNTYTHWLTHIQIVTVTMHKTTVYTTTGQFQSQWTLLYA